MSWRDSTQTVADLEHAAQRVADEAASLNAGLRLLDESHYSAGHELSLILDAVLLHSRRMANFLLREPCGDDLAAHLFFDAGEAWRYQLAGCPYLASQQASLDRAVLFFEREPSEAELAGWNLTALSNELASKWDGFLAMLPAERLPWFLIPGTAMLLRLHRIRGKLYYAGSPPRLLRR